MTGDMNTAEISLEKTAEISGKRLRDIDVSKVTFNEYQTGRIWAAAEKHGAYRFLFGDLPLEHIMMPVRAAKFSLCKRQ